MAIRSPLNPLLALVVLLQLSCNVENQTTTEESELGFDLLFAEESVALLYLTPESGWQTMLDSFLTSGDESYQRAAMAIDGEELAVVGLRIKGDVDEDDGTGKTEDKYALKVNFNYFDGPRFHGIDKLHIENNAPDPSAMREVLATRLYRAMGVPASRTRYAEVSMAGEDFGVYTLIEDIDKQFLKDQFGTANHADDGNLYECEVPGCALLYVGNQKSNYVNGTEDDAVGLVLQTNIDDPEQNTYADLIEFLDVLNNTPDDDFESAIQEVFDVDTFLRWLAVAVAIGDYDSYLGQPDNFYLYHRPDTGRFVFIPTDHNRAYLGKKCKGSFEATGADLDNPVCGVTDRPLLDRILAVPAFKATYLTHLDQVVTDYFNPTVQGQWIQEVDDLVGWQIAEDPLRPADEVDYYDAISAEEYDGSPPYLRTYVAARYEYLAALLAQP